MRKWSDSSDTVLFIHYLVIHEKQSSRDQRGIYIVPCQCHGVDTEICTEALGKGELTRDPYRALTEAV